VQCSHCGREVKATVHFRKADPGYRVDYYLLWTGDLEEVAMKNPRDESEIMEFYKLNNPRKVITCSECAQKSEIQAELERLFSGVPKPGEGLKAK
jgi:transcription elongation factor Elf1